MIFTRDIRPVSELEGKTFVKVCQVDNNKIQFWLNDREYYEFFHDQDCCEDVHIEDICGDLADLENETIVSANEETNNAAVQTFDAYETWTFYKIQSTRGNVTLRWYGTSNGYYSEDVYLRFVTAPQTT